MRLVDADKEIEFYKRILYNPTPDVSESDRWHTHAIVNAFERAKTVESRTKGKWIKTKDELPSGDNDWVIAVVREKDTGFIWLPRVMEYRNLLMIGCFKMNEVGCPTKLIKGWKLLRGVRCPNHTPQIWKVEE